MRPSSDDAGATRAGASLRSPWTLLVAVVAGACLVVSVSYRIYDPDIWQNLTVGRAIWEMKRVPTTQLWSWPTYGAPDVKWTWGFSALAWPVWEAWGVWGLYGWRWATTLLAFGFLWAAARAMGARGLVPLVVLVVCGLVWRARSQVRPETLAAVLLAAQVWVLESRRQGGRDRTWWLVPIAWGWANVHNTWFLGFGLTGIHLLHDLFARRGARAAPRPRKQARAASRSAAPGGAGATRGGTPPEVARAEATPAARAGVPGIVARAAASRWWLLWVGLAALAISFANPYGWRALWQPFDFFIHQRNEPIFKSIGELGPIDWGIYWKKGLPFLVAGWPLLMMWRIRRRGLDLVELLCCVSFTSIALMAQRFLGLYALVAAPYVGRGLAEWLADSQPARLAHLPVAARAALTAVACVAACWLEWSRAEMPLGIGFVWNKYPVAACDFMEANGVRGRGFNQFGFAGYQLYRFWPDRERLPFIDIHQSGTKEDRYVYAWVQQSEEAWRTLDGKYRFDYALVGRGLFERYSLLNQLDADSTWALVFVDDVMALYVRRDGPLAPLARRLAYHELPGGSKRLVAMGEATAGDSLLRARVATELERVIAGSPEHAQALLLKANLAAADGRLDDARALLERALEVNPFREGAHLRLAVLDLEAGRPRDALREVARERAFADPSARHDMVEARAWARLGDAGRARAAYQRALKRDPGNAEARDSLAALGGGAS